MRIFGGIAALTICVLFGWSKAAAIRLREETMRCFSLDMKALAAEMEYCPREIGNMIRRLYGGKLGGFWQSFGEAIPCAESVEQAWRQTAVEYGGFGVLSRDEMETLLQAGSSIGRYTAEEGAKALKHWSGEAQRRADELHKQSLSKGAVYQKLGLLGGLAAMLLIV